MKFYAAENSYGSENSIGFYNTWNALVFNSRSARDDYVQDNSPHNISIKSITRREATAYLQSEPTPFTHEHYALFDRYKFHPTLEAPDGYVGTLEVCKGPWGGDHDPEYIEPFYK